MLHRLEFPLPLNYLCQASWGACFMVPDVQELASVPVLLAVAANLLLILSGLALNNAVDIRTDARHRSKGYLADAVTRFGRTRALRWSAGEAALALALCCWDGVVLLLAVLTVVAHLLYNLEPVRLKRRGFAGSVVFGLSMTTLPCLLSASAAGPLAPVPWLVFAGLGVLASARTVWWSIPDLRADAASGMKTPVVRHGLAGATRVATSAGLLGLLLLGWGLWLRFGPFWMVVGLAAYGAFLGVMVRSEAVSPVRMLRRTMPLVTVADVVLALVPLVH